MLRSQAILVALAVGLMAPALSWAAESSSGACTAIPPNDLRIPVPSKGVSGGIGGISETQFLSVVDRLRSAYPGIEFRHNWARAEVNAYAMVTKKGEQVVVLNGGLARHPAMTEEGFLLIGCHEVGHHYGGAPRRTGLTRDKWASVEGQADYFGTLKCLRRIWQGEDNAAAIGLRVVDPTVEAECSRQFPEAGDRDSCRRASFATLSLTRLFAELASEPLPGFDTPDRSWVDQTFETHPKAQCRMDTLFQGSLCTVPLEERLDGTNPYQGTCAARTGFDRGARSACWFFER
jgi:hypothetical protein